MCRPVVCVTFLFFNWAPVFWTVGAASYSLLAKERTVTHAPNRAQEVPEVPQHLAVAGFTSRTANLTWRHPFDGKSEITSFHVEYKKSHREPNINSLSKCIFT